MVEIDHDPFCIYLTDGAPEDGCAISLTSEQARHLIFKLHREILEHEKTKIKFEAFQASKDR